LAVEDRNFSVYITTNHKTCFNENWIHTSQCKSNTLLSLRHLNVQEDVNMKYIHTTDVSPQALVARNYPPTHTLYNFLLTYLFSSLFPYFNLYVSIFI
jgi:hypothetical protein